jgi:hypothetical protein
MIRVENRVSESIMRRQKKLVRRAINLNRRRSKT